VHVQAAVALVVAEMSGLALALKALNDAALVVAEMSDLALMFEALNNAALVVATLTAGEVAAILSKVKSHLK
jgi:hypothetical protein